MIHVGDPKFRRLCILAGIVAALFFSFSAFAQTAPRKFLRGHVPSAIARFNLQPISRLPATNRLDLAVGLPLRNQDVLDKLLRDISDPASPTFHHYLTPEEFTENFGPTEMDYQRVIDFAQASGLTVTRTYSNRVVLDVSGPVASIEKAFQVNLNYYQHPTKNRTFFAPDVEPSVDSDVPILDVSGLNNFAPPHPNLQPRPQNLAANATPKLGSGPGFTYWGNDFRNAYAPGVSMTGSGQALGLVEFDGYYSNDIVSYESQSGLPVVPLQNRLLDGVSGSPGFSGISGAVVEVSLDIEVAIAMAPGLSRLIVYEGTSANDILSQMAGDNQAKQLSTSWSWDTTTNATTDHLFQQFAAQGQSFFDASGDSDAYPAGTATGEPNDNPFITIVGGTTLTTSGAAWTAETTWNWGQNQGSSGGVSTFYKIPSWQANAGATAAGGSATMRNIPDVSLTADNVWVIYGNGLDEVVGGTSVAAPLWAGFTALVNQQSVAAGRSTVGFINPAIYAIAAETNYAADFHDITTGNNFNSSSPTNFSAVPSYDLCTGLGTPAGQNLINDLAGPPDPLGITPAASFSASGPIGGPFSATNWIFSLTNLGTASLNWTLGSTSSWLQVSSSGGALAPGGSATTVTVSLNSAANNLGAGNYNAAVLFTNQSSGVVQGHQFTLQIFQPLLVSPETGFTSAGAVGGPFTVTAQNFSLTNIGVTPLNWGVINTSLWLNATPGGALAAGGAVTATVSLNPAATNLVAGIYSATLWFTNQTAGGAQVEQFMLLVGQPLVQNGGFETGDFTGWTLVGDAGTVNYVDTGTYITPHSGSYAAAMGQVTTLANLSQTLPTSAGQTYLLSMWLDSPSVSHQKLTPNEFTVAWNGITLFDKTNIGRIGWTNLQFIVKATDSTAVLQFGARDDYWYLGIDDVSVTPIAPPSLTTQPTNLAVLSGSTAVFSASASGSAPLVYHWRINGTNLVNSGNISGATTNVLNITAATIANSGNYDLVVTNAYGSVTSSVAVLTIAVPPAITGSLTNQTVECGGSANFTVNVSGTPPLSYQWSLNSAGISGATNASFSLSGVHPPGYTIGVTITNLYGSVSSNVVLTVQRHHSAGHHTERRQSNLRRTGRRVHRSRRDGERCLRGFSFSFRQRNRQSQRSRNEHAFLLRQRQQRQHQHRHAHRHRARHHAAGDFVELHEFGFGGGHKLQRKDARRDGNELYSRHGFVRRADDLANADEQFYFAAGTNTVVITAADASGNAAFSTNTIVVQDETPPQILIQPQSPTNLVGTAANFSVAATACTPPSYPMVFQQRLLCRPDQQHADDGLPPTRPTPEIIPSSPARPAVPPPASSPR